MARQADLSTCIQVTCVQVTVFFHLGCVRKKEAGLDVTKSRLLCRNVLNYILLFPLVGVLLPSTLAMANWFSESLFIPKDLERPLYLVKVAKQKYGDDIFVLGATQAELDKFWNHDVKYRAISIDEQPSRKGRTIVDIDTKSHINNREEDENLNAPDRNDVFEITSKTGSSQSTTKTYRLQFGETYTFQVGGSLDLKPQFFNVAGGGIGISGSRTKQTSKQETKDATENETLTQEYQLVEKLVVPPKTKVTATIKSYAVTYELGQSVTEVSAPKNSFIPVHYRTMLSRRWTGGILVTTGYITARELFQGRPKFRVKDGMVYFEEQAKGSYIGEEVEISKEKENV